ncbi:MAG: SRPBCC family protein [Leptolyngbya sp.]|nr:SRPBCC family protein [Candidatus Melainabacteria bacterium]
MNKNIKIMLVIMAVIFAAPFVAALFMPQTFVVEREIVIDKPNSEVFEFVKNLKNQEKYSKWFIVDPHIKKKYTGTDGTVGFVMAWDSDNEAVGKGEQEIKKIDDGKRVDVEIRMIKPFQSTDPAYTTTESIGENQTKVKSVYSGKMNYPMNLLCGIGVDKLGHEMHVNLVNLKNTLQGSKDAPPEDIKTH